MTHFHKINTLLQIKWRGLKEANADTCIPDKLSQWCHNFVLFQTGAAELLMKILWQCNHAIVQHEKK